MGQVRWVINDAGSFTWNAGVDVDEVTVELWGGGGSGGRSSGPDVNGSGGGGGGAYARSVISITPETAHDVVVGAGGANPGAPGNGLPGTDSTFDTNVVLARRGTGGLRGSALGGQGDGGGPGPINGANQSTGDVTFGGGNGGGGAAAQANGGGGGGAAGDQANGGGGASNRTAGTGGNAGGGAGGVGATSGTAATPGNPPGGGGGGGAPLSPGSTGAAGADGKAILTWDDPAVTDTVVVSDQATLTVSYNREFTDEATVTDLIATTVGYNRQFDDQVTAADASFASIGKFLSDQVTATDAITGKTVGKGLSDNVTAVDTFDRTVEYFRTLDDTATAVDAIAKHITLSFSDSISESESPSVTIRPVMLFD